MFERPGRKAMRKNSAWSAAGPMLALSIIALGWGTSSCLKREYDGIGEPTPGQGFGESTDSAGGTGGIGTDAEPFDAAGGMAGQPEAGPDTGPDADSGADAEPDAGPKPVTWLRFENDEGPVVDSMGTTEGEVWGDVKRSQPGRIGNCFSFGPERGRVRLPVKPEHVFETAATIELWYRRKTSTMPSPLISCGVSSEDNVAMTLDDCGSVWANFTDYGPFRQADVSTNCGSVQDDVWTHLAVTDDGTTLTLYINAEPVDTDEGGVFFDLDDEIWIGDSSDGVEIWHVGEIDEVKWWTIARTREEICYDAGGEWHNLVCTLD